MPTKTLSQNVKFKKSRNVYRDLASLQVRYPLCYYRLPLHPAIVLFSKKVCLLTQRGQCTNRELLISDRELILQKHQTRNANHASSERSKIVTHLKYSPNPSMEIGDLVYLYCDRNKSKARNRKLVVSADGEWCQIRKFVDNQLRQSSYKVKISECYFVPLLYSVCRIPVTPSRKRSPLISCTTISYDSLHTM